MIKTFKLGRKKIGLNYKPYFIAEVGVNHENKLSRAKKMIELAKEGGADGVKFQAYTAEKLACKHSPSYWDTKQVPVKSQYKLFKKFDKFGSKEYEILKKFCDDIKIDFLSTPFDLDAVDYLNDLVPFFKVASADLTNFPLLRKICSKKKPIVLSTGASQIEEIKNSVKFINKTNPNNKLILLHCILSYPTDYNFAHLEVIKNLSKQFPKNIIGLSDHTFPDDNMIVLTTAYMQGARVIEKHFSDMKGKKGNDHFHSLDKNDLKKFIYNIDIVSKIIKKEKGRPIFKCEKVSRKNARRSIVTLGNIKKNQIFKEENLIMKRPGFGISPIKVNKIYGKRAKRDLKDDHIIKWSDIKF